MAAKGGQNGTQVRGHTGKAQFPSSLAAIVSETVRL